MRSVSTTAVYASATASGADGGSIVIVTVAVSWPRLLVSVYVKLSVGGLIVSAGGVYVNVPVGLRSTLPPRAVVAAKAVIVP